MKGLPRVLAAAGIGVVAVLGPVAGASAQRADEITIAIEPPETSLILGDKLDLSITVTNTGAAAAAGSILHLDVAEPGLSGSVDPEDWTSTLSKPLPDIEPGQSVTVDWNVQPIAGGNFAVYAVVLFPGSDTTTVSNVTQVAVADRRSLNPNGILPIAIAMPAAVGALLFLQIRMARRVRHDGFPQPATG